MAALLRCRTQVVCISGKSIAVFTLGSEGRQIYSCLRPENERIGGGDATAAGTGHSQETSEDGGGAEGGKEGGKEGAIEGGTDRILAAAFSPSGQYFAATDDHKWLTIWRTAGSEWTVISSRYVTRRCTTLTFTNDEEVVLAADKSGDVHSFSVSKAEEASKLVLGHLSMLLDMVLSDDNSHVLTADRDEKIRVSCFPNGYNIHSYCLGHKEYVTRLQLVGEKNLLVSGGGDGTIRLWDYSEGTELACRKCDEDVPEKILKELRNISVKEEEAEGEENPRARESLVVSRMVYCRKTNALVVTLYGLPYILLYHLECTAGSAPAIRFIERLEVGREPLDLEIDTDSRLWVLQPANGKTCQVFNIIPEKKVPKLVPCSESATGGVGAVMQQINGEGEFFKDCKDVQDILTNLQKARIDNMAEYIERKKKRMEGQPLAPPSGRNKNKNQPPGDSQGNQKQTPVKSDSVDPPSEKKQKLDDS